MTYSLSPVINGNQYFFDNAGPLSGGLVYAYLTGTTTLAPTYTDSTGTVGNSNPMVLNSSGRPTTEVWLDSEIVYDLWVKTPTGDDIVQYNEIQGLPLSTDARGASIIYENGQQFFDNDGLPLAGGLIYTYYNGSNSIKATTWSDLGGTQQNANPIVLDSTGTLTTDIFLSSASEYNFVLCEPNGTVLQTCGGVTTVANPDPYFGLVQLLAHFDGSNGSTTFVDNSLNPKSMSQVGGCAISTAQSVFGGASVKSTTTDNSRVITQDAGCRLTGDFTIEFRLRMPDVSAGKYFFISNYVPGSSWLWINTTTGSRLTAYIMGSNVPDSSVAISPDTWYAIAVTRNGLARRLFINGEIVSQDNASSINNQPIDTGWSIGGPAPSMASGSANCWIDELRITNGVARYTENYTPATEAFPNQ